MSLGRVGLAGALVVVLLGCNEGGSPAPEAAASASPADGAGTASASASVSATASATASASAAAPEPKDEQSPHAALIPTIPTEAAPRPAAEAFAAAETINTAPEDRRPDHCGMKLVGQWLQIDCHTSAMISVRELDWGKAGEDYVDGHPLYLRLRPGTAQRGHLTPLEGRAVLLNVAWPTGDAKPWLIALEEKAKLAAHEMDVQEEATPLDAIAFVADPPRPAEADWVRAEPVNTAPAAERPKGCTMKTVGGWLRVSCAGQGTLVDMLVLKGFGKAGKDYFRRTVLAGKSVELDLPLKAGHDYRAMVTDDFEHRATLHVEWPEGAPRPQRLALTTKR
ncbi:MAG: hypothetical protein R3B72_49235 [Polyangiaceae bacterium]